MPQYTVICDGCSLQLTTEGSTDQNARRALRRRVTAEGWAAPSLTAQKLTWTNVSLRVDAAAFLRNQQFAHGPNEDLCAACCRNRSLRAEVA